MIPVRFIAADGTVTDACAEPGARLLDVAQGCGQPLEGTCEGQMACATCHVIVDPRDFARLPRASGDEEDMLDFAPGAQPHSRLACQVMIDEALGSFTVHIPAEAR